MTTKPRDSKTLAEDASKELGDSTRMMQLVDELNRAVDQERREIQSRNGLAVEDLV